MGGEGDNYFYHPAGFVIGNSPENCLLCTKLQSQNEHFKFGIGGTIQPTRTIRL